MLPLLLWWLLIQIIGLAAWPLAFRLFRRLPDRGYGISKPLGLLLTGYFFWMGGILGFLGNDGGGMLLALLLTVGLSLWFYRQADEGEPGLPAWMRANGRLILATEALFAVALAAWTLYRAYVPDIETAGGEKFMEIAFLNAIRRSSGMPPHDPWLSGFAISYYYFGYVLMSLMIRLSGVPTAVGFNLGIALLFALTGTAAFGLVYNLVTGRLNVRLHPTALRYALLGALFVLVLSNWEGSLEVARQAGLGPPAFWKALDIPELDKPPSAAEAAGGWRPARFRWWWRASRVVTDRTPTGDRHENIDEFPFFSFLLGDMHPHVLALPFDLLALTIALNLLWGGREEGAQQDNRPARAAEWGVMALALGGLGFLNTWDFPIHSLIVVAAVGLRRIRTQGLDRGIRAALRFALTLGGLGVLLYLPFYVGFQSQASGLLVHIFSPTRLHQFLVMFGPLLAVNGGFLLMLLRRAEGQTRLLAFWTALLIALLLLFFIGLVLLTLQAVPAVSQRIAPYLGGVDALPQALAWIARVRLTMPWTLLLLAAGLGAAYALVWREWMGSGNAKASWLSDEDAFALLLIGAGAALTLLPDFVYLRDLFGVRLNTVFKFYYQAWLLWAVAGAYGVHRLLERGWGAAGWKVLLLAAALGPGFVYPPLAISTRTGEFQDTPRLDGTRQFARAPYPEDYAAIQWLNEHVADAPVILEKPGGGYEYAGRVSALTGLPTVLGWAGHEYQWRGSYDEQARRERAIETIYAGTDPQETWALLEQYDVAYVYVGPLEREAYPAEGLAKFDRMLKVVYQNPGVTIYAVRR